MRQEILYLEPRDKRNLDLCSSNMHWDSNPTPLGMAAYQRSKKLPKIAKILGGGRWGCAYCSIPFNSYGHGSQPKKYTKIFVCHRVTEAILEVPRLAELNRG